MSDSAREEGNKGEGGEARGKCERVKGSVLLLFLAVSVRERGSELIPASD